MPKRGYCGAMRFLLTAAWTVEANKGERGPDPSRCKEFRS